MALNKRTGLNHFDSLELLHCKSSLHEFPLHYHDTFCLTIIHDGVMGENEVFSPAGTLLISHPFEVHQNRLIHQTGYSFTTFYISPDLMGTLPNQITYFLKKR